MKFAIAALPTPIFNDPSLDEFLGHKNGSLSINQKGRLAYLEMIAFEGTFFSVHEAVTSYVYRVTTEEYPAQYPLYVDCRSLKSIPEIPTQKKTCPPKEKILEILLLQKGRPYLWGGNLGKPLSIMQDWYPSPFPLSPYEQMVKTFNGIDCSGLIYLASGGYTPRNTSAMVGFGRAVQIERKPYSSWNLQPLDLILDLGHVAIVIDDTWSIQSKEKMGVFLIRTKDLIDSLLRRKTPKDHWDSIEMDEIFHIRRFI